MGYLDADKEVHLLFQIKKINENTKQNTKND